MPRNHIRLSKPPGVEATQLHLVPQRPTRDDLSSGTKRSAASDAEQLTVVARYDSANIGLGLLLQAHVYAHEAGADLWEFALRIDRLFNAGLTINDLRWLVTKGFAEHGLETSVYGDSHRAFQRGKGLYFEPSTCLILSPKGVALAKARANASMPIVEGEFTTVLSDIFADSDISGIIESERKPCWHSARRELWLADTMVKRFRVPARNQESILNAFEEECWPPHIDDPLPSSRDTDPRTRLSDAIYRLNRNQSNSLLRFHANGNANGVLWVRLYPNAADDRVQHAQI